jgi:hypothetical protein
MVMETLYFQKLRVKINEFLKIDLSFNTDSITDFIYDASVWDDNFMNIKFLSYVEILTFNIRRQLY